MPSEPTSPNRPCGLTTPPKGGPKPSHQCTTPRIPNQASTPLSDSRDPAIYLPPPCFAFAGDSSVGATPVPIPNTVVKPDSADGTPVARPRESRPSPAPL